MRPDSVTRNRCVCGTLLDSTTLNFPNLFHHPSVLRRLPPLRELVLDRCFDTHTAHSRGEDRTCQPQYRTDEIAPHSSPHMSQICSFIALFHRTVHMYVVKHTKTGDPQDRQQPLEHPRDAIVPDYHAIDDQCDQRDAEDGFCIDEVCLGRGASVRKFDGVGNARCETEDELQEPDAEAEKEDERLIGFGVDGGFEVTGFDEVHLEVGRRWQLGAMIRRTNTLRELGVRVVKVRWHSHG
jgi:hypothetical protein